MKKRQGKYSTTPMIVLLDCKKCKGSFPEKEMWDGLCDKCITKSRHEKK